MMVYGGGDAFLSQREDMDMKKAEVETVGKVTLSCLKNVRKETSNQTKTLGVGLSVFLPAQIEFLFKALPNKGEELSTATAR